MCLSGECETNDVPRLKFDDAILCRNLTPQPVPAGTVHIIIRYDTFVAELYTN